MLSAVLQHVYYLSIILFRKHKDIPHGELLSDISRAVAHFILLVHPLFSPPFLSLLVSAATLLNDPTSLHPLLLLSSFLVVRFAAFFHFCLPRLFLFLILISLSFHSSTSNPRPSTMRSASWYVRRWACCSPFSCQSLGSSSACAAAVTTAAERCTNASGRMQTAGAACWERCSSPPHWSSREYDTRTRSHDTAEAEYADICSLACYRVLWCRSARGTCTNTRITVMARFVVMYT